MSNERIDPAPNDEVSVLRTIASSLTQIKGSAALSHYHSHCVWVARLNEQFERSVNLLKDLTARGAEMLTSDSSAAPLALDPTSALHQFRKIVPAMLRNQVALATRYVRGTRPEPSYRMHRDPSPQKTFDDFSQLTTLTRQYVDSTVQDAYQLALLDAKEFNFHVLKSLHSFVHLATESLQVPFMSAELASIINWYDRTPWKHRKNSTVTSCRKERFSEKVDFLVSELKPQFDLAVSGTTKATFTFCSEFTHVGYVSTLVTSRDGDEIYLAGPDDDCFLPSTENYVELEYMLLKGSYLLFADLYLRAVGGALSRLLDPRASTELVEVLKAEIANGHKVLKATGLSYTQFIAKPYDRRSKKLVWKCICGQLREWAEPFEQWFNFCTSCGTRYKIIEWPQNVGYVLLLQGPCDVVGSVHPVIDDLGQADRDRVYTLWEEFKLNERAKKVATKHLQPALAIKDLRTFVLPKDARRNENLYTFVCGKKLSENDGMPIFCNCGCVTVIMRGFESESFECFGCGSAIKMLAVEGDPGYVLGYDPDGSPRLIPVQGSDAKSLDELTPDEQNRILKPALQKRDGGKLDDSTAQ